MRTKTTTLSLAVSALVVSSLAALAEGTAAPAYVGTWASDLAQCKVGQDRQEAPLVLSKDGYDQYETHCKFTSVNGQDNEWKVKSECTIEGTAEPYEFALTVSGDTLTVTDDTGSRDLLICK
ncbi:hypothetical protein [uncultured Hyphomicrobium sp.]|uniref:hypothetical protein n=1 Tax=uncultured Hyphomicrobium sp. TaxID=194373 RepID=UPI0025DEDC67|nr:hypothetical protein [uncultured Hyphomicrobium sp.]